MTVLSVWVVYERPLDHPDHFVARRWVTGDGFYNPTTDMFVEPTLEQVRAMLPSRGLVCLRRNATDDPQIVESWI